MRWFSHRRSCSHRRRHAPEDSSRKKCRTRTALQRTTPEQNAALFSFFLSRWPWPLTLTLTFELGRDFCTVHLTAKFHRPKFNRSAVIMLTNRQTDSRQTNKHPLGSAMLRRWVITCSRLISVATVRRALGSGSFKISERWGIISSLKFPNSKVAVHSCMYVTFQYTLSIFSVNNFRGQGQCPQDMPVISRCT